MKAEIPELQLDTRGALWSTKIDKAARAEFRAWADALHVTEAELSAAIEVVGDEVGHVITYLLKHSKLHD
jgi:hypothetical protein